MLLVLQLQGLRHDVRCKETRAIAFPAALFAGYVKNRALANRAQILYKITVMKALLYSQLAGSHPLLRDHVRLGADCNLEASNVAVTGVASSFATLDAFLPWRGWPLGAMTEIMTDIPGCGELSLLLPAMSRLTQQKRPILCIGAPHELFAPALTQADVDPAFVTQINPSSSTHQHIRDNLWSAEQALRTGLPGMVLLWSQSRTGCSPEALRRLHLSTLGRATMLVHFRGKSSMSQPSPAWLRFGYVADETHIHLQVLKCRGRELTRPLIALDRATVQTRLYAQNRAARLLDGAVEFGINSIPQIAAANQYATVALASLANPSNVNPIAKAAGNDSPRTPAPSAKSEITISSTAFHASH